MRCPFCHNPDSRVIDSREADEGATTRRRRNCPRCGRRFTTVEEAVLAVVKRNGVSDITPEDYLIDNCSQRAVNFILSTAHRHHQWAGIR